MPSGEKRFSRIMGWIVSIVTIALLAAALLPNFLRARERSRATTILNDARVLDAAIDRYAVTRKVQPEATVTWEDIAPYLNANSRLRESGGKDLWGNRFIIGPTVKDGVSFGPETLRRYDTSVVPSSFWGEYGERPSPASP